MAIMSPDRYCHDPELYINTNASSEANAQEVRMDLDEDGSCDDQTCWKGYWEQPYAYILSVPMTLALAVKNYAPVIIL